MVPKGILRQMIVTTIKNRSDKERSKDEGHVAIGAAWLDNAVETLLREKDSASAAAAGRRLIADLFAEYPTGYLVCLDGYEGTAERMPLGSKYGPLHLDA